MAEVRLVPETLPRELARTLCPAWLLVGDEPLLIGECADLIRERAHLAGYGAREVYFIGRGYDWAALAQEMRSLSLFSEKRLLELRLPTGKPGAEGSQLLSELARATPPDLLVLVLAEQLEWTDRSAAWVKAFESSAALVEIERPTAEQLPTWVATRLKKVGLEAEPEAIQLIADRCEGNLLAAHQEIARLALDATPGPLSAEAVAEFIGNSARFDVFKLGEAMLAGDATRALRIIEGLEQEGEEPTLVLWAIAEELRALLQWRPDSGRGTPGRLWRGGRRRQALLAQAARRLPRTRVEALLLAAQRADLLVKGARGARAWDELGRLAVATAGGALELSAS
jgi:DNA polymerase-3 subunit delta